MKLNEKVSEKFGDVLLDGGKILFAGAVVGNVFENQDSGNFIIAGGVFAVLFIVAGLIFVNMSSEKKGGKKWK